VRQLSKKVCKGCRKQYGWAWYEDIERAWNKEGKIVCPATLRPDDPHANDISEGPPEFCPFVLEHLLELQDVK